MDINGKKLRYAVRAVRQRLANAESYRSEIPDVEIFVDKYGHAFFSFIRALSELTDDPVVLLEDDVILCQNFKERCEAEIAKHPDSIIQFFSMRGKDLTVGSRWDNNFMMNQCTYYPPRKCRALVDYYYGHNRWRMHNGSGADVFVQHYLKANREKYWIVVPNLVDHLVQKSVIDPRRSSKRVSKTFQKDVPRKAGND